MSSCLALKEPYKSGTLPASIHLKFPRRTLSCGCKASFLCEVCANYFCLVCPQKTGVSAVNCPMCGANCQKLNDPVKQNFQTPNSQLPVSSLNQRPPVERINPFPPQNLPVINSMEEVNRHPKSSGAGIFALVLIAFLFSGAIAYFWAYQISVPDEEAEKKLPKIVALEETLKVEKAEEERKWEEAQKAAKLKREAEIALQQANLTSGGSGGSSGCFNGMTNKPMPCDPSLEKFSNSMAEKYKDMNAGFKLPEPNFDQFTQNFRPPQCRRGEF